VVSDMQNFYERNQKIFASAVNEFPDAANIEASQGTANVKKLSWDYTQQVLKYNENLQWYKNYQNHWFVGSFVTKIPENLEFIDLNNKKN
jgi:hypothetical protein